MTQTDLLFDLDLGLALKKMGLDRAESTRSDALALGRAYCRRAALSRPDRLSSADDAALGFQLAGLPPDMLGNAAGALFRTGEWIPTDTFLPSTRVSRRAGMNRLWRLKVPEHDIAASNARQNEYWQRVGGHPPPGYQDSDEQDN